jgi:indole-3-glycerol phosphate synthase
MAHILNQIVNDKKTLIKDRKVSFGESLLTGSEAFERECFSLVKKVETLNYPWVISEFKRKSPSRAEIDLKARVDDVILRYSEDGATAISILTDEKYFGGSSDDLVRARELTQLPILRKEFIIDPYQVIESKYLGADFILLIAEILTKSQVKELSKLAKECGLEVLLEMHTGDQIHKYCENIDFIGINNRDLTSFETHIDTSVKWASYLPHDVIKISESGIQSVDDVRKLWQCGYTGFLVGEHLMTRNAHLYTEEGFMTQLKKITC